MTTDYRAMCAELVDTIGSLVGGVKCGHYQQRDMWKCREIFDRARAALAKPEPVAPTDEELLGLYGVATPSYHIEEYRRELDFARAVLARWGTPANTINQED